jgi:transcriptional regulator with XRE-family HTH domain
VASPAQWSIDLAAIDRARIVRGWTRRDLGRAAHVDEGTLRDLFAGGRRPTFGTLRAIGSVLGLSLVEMVRFEPTETVVLSRGRSAGSQNVTGGPC